MTYKEWTNIKPIKVTKNIHNNKVLIQLTKIDEYEYLLETTFFIEKPSGDGYEHITSISKITEIEAYDIYTKL